MAFRGFVDCHSHVCPSGDDGAPSVQTGTWLCREAAKRGTRVLFATPHVWPELPLDEERERRVRATFAELRPQAGLELRLGFELSPHRRLLDDDARRYELGGTGRVLMEVPFTGRLDVLYALADQGRVIRLPVHVAEQVRRAQRSRRQLAQKLNRDPSVAEIAKESGFTEKRVHELFDLVEDPISLETPVGDGESNYADLIEDVQSDDPGEQTAQHLRTSELAEALSRLNPRMRHVLALRFGLEGQRPHTLEEVGAGLGITRERVRQLETRALRELRVVAPGLQLYIQS
jgi:RNA polymerase sigma factor (sigma-70 family)